MTLQESNAKRWAAMHIPAQYGSTFEAVANRLSAPEAMKRYKAVEKLTGVPWQFIAVTHEREASQRWNTQLGQGDPLNRKSTHVPKGRGPFNTWEEGAVDALVNCPPYAARNKDWSIGGTLAMLEKYNGLGYAGMGRPSPYIWSHTDQYVSGKYVADHVYDPNVVDSQLGCAGILKFMGWKSDKVSGPATAVVAGSGAMYTFWNHIQAHPYISSIALAAGIALVWWCVHTLRNKTWTSSQPSTGTATPLGTDGGLKTSGDLAGPSSPQ